MRRRHFPFALLPAMSLLTPHAFADASGPSLASYYALHMALADGVAWAWRGTAKPQRQEAGAKRWVQVGVSERDCHALSADGELWRWSPEGGVPRRLMAGLRRFAVGASGWFGIDLGQRLWYGSGDAPAQQLAAGVSDACVGDSADYYVGSDGLLWVRGLAHRGQYGDGLLKASPHFVNTATGVVAVRSHTGHAIALRQDGAVLGTGGNRFGPLSSHGLGDKADRWGVIFQGAQAIATGSRHSLAIARGASLWAWGEGFRIEPQRLLDGTLACAGGDTATIAWLANGDLVQWERGQEVGRHRLS